mgnify:CR=1 FL=1
MPAGLRLDAACAVDYRDARAYAQGLLEPEHPSPHASAAEIRTSIALLCLELLPDSYDDWVLDEAEDWRLLRASALEALAATLSTENQNEAVRVYERFALALHDALSVSPSAALRALVGVPGAARS